jgi:flagellar basal-body rod protein FlgF
VNPDTSKLFKGHDGLFYVAGGEGSVDSDGSVKLIPHQLEGSNVNAIELMTQIIDLSRSYEIHTNFMKTISDNASKSNQLLNMNA